MKIFPTYETDIHELHPNDWNPNKQSHFMYEREKRSIKKFGFVDPITVRRVEGQLEIVDGEHRWRAAKDLGLTAVSVTDLGEVSIVQAKALTDVLNNLKGNPDAYRQNQLIEDILAAEPELKDVLPYTEAQLAQYVDAVNWDGLDAADRSKPRPAKGHVTLNVPLTSEQHEVVKHALEVAKSKLEEQGDAAALVFLAKEFLRQVERVEQQSTPPKHGDALQGL